ncbi:hypothetical protein J6590_070663 [Homalodisca vitripennis]|nr:hypothetical protein J6590_070663 [Homalodisca vitripennis]
MQVTIDAEVRETTRNITLHAKGLILGPATIIKEDNDSSIEISGQETKGPLVTFLVSSSLQPGDRVTFRIPFSGRLNPSRQRGYYRIKTGNQDTDWMSGTVFEFNHAREAFPCFDEPEFKSKFRISLIHHQNHTALSNMPVVSSHSFENKGDWVVDHFDNTPMLSSYLVAYHLLKSGFRETQTEDGRPLRVWASTKQLRWVNDSLDLAPRALSHLEKLTGLSDPLPKQDLVVVPRFQGALENWGVMSFMPSGLIYRPGKDGSMLQRVLSTKLVTHELSHTWFGNLVTPQWWDSLWLSEGAATFFTSLIIDQMEPEWEQFNSDTEEHLTTTFFSNAVSSPGYALNHPVEWAKDLRTVSSAPYFKGFSLIRMLYFSLGKEKFQEGIQRYLSELQYKTTTPQLFYQAMQYSYEGQELSKLMDSWTYRSGLPVVFVNRSEGQLILSQERFYMALYQSEEKLKTMEKTQWWIPVSYTSNSEKSFGDPKPKFWFNDENKTLEDPAKPEDWLLLNVQAAGTYHVRYDKANLELIKNALRNSSLDDIPPLNRFQLVLDYGMFGLAGLEPLDEVLDLMDYLGREQHFAPWAAGIRIFWRMDQRLRNTQAGFRLKLSSALCQDSVVTRFYCVGERDLSRDGLHFNSRGVSRLGSQLLDVISAVLGSSVAATLPCSQDGAVPVALGSEPGIDVFSNHESLESLGLSRKISLLCG